MSTRRVGRPVWAILIAFAALWVFTPPAGADEPFTLATWNVRFLSNGSRDDAELTLIAQIISRYEFVALQEARDTAVLDRLLAMLPDYTYLASPPVGRGVSERYAFFYRPARVSVVAPAALCPDPDDRFIREPFVGHFRVDQFDFTVITIHVIFGDSVAERRTEVSALATVVAAVDEHNGPENDVLLVGDFNLPADDPAWTLARYEPLVAAHIPTTISDRSSYDNIWYSPAATTEILPEVSIYRFDEHLFANDDRAASLAVSDHRPVRARFVTTVDDDAPNALADQ